MIATYKKKCMHACLSLLTPSPPVSNYYNHTNNAQKSDKAYPFVTAQKEIPILLGCQKAYSPLVFMQKEL